MEELFDKLTDYEKNILLIYKSYYHYAINNIDNINDPDILGNIKDLYEYYKGILSNPNNLFISMVFKPIDNSSFESFIKSIKKISEDLNGLKGKIKLDSDITLYRCVSMQEDDDTFDIAKGNLISTSKSLDVAKKFIIQGPYKNVTYEIKVGKDTPILVVPYSIKITDDLKLKIVKNDSQDEIILFKDSLDFNYTVSGDKVLVEANKKDKHL